MRPPFIVARGQLGVLTATVVRREPGEDKQKDEVRIGGADGYSNLSRSRRCGTRNVLDFFSNQVMVDGKQRQLETVGHA